MAARIGTMKQLQAMLAKGGATIPAPIRRHGRQRAKGPKPIRKISAWDLPGQAHRDCAEVTLDLTMPPSLSACFFNLKRGGRAISKVYRAWIKQALASLMAAKVGRVDGRVSVSVTMRRHNAGADADNRLKALGDILTKAGIIRDDKHIAAWTVAWSDEGADVRMIVSRVQVTVGQAAAGADA